MRTSPIANGTPARSAAGLAQSLGNVLLTAADVVATWNDRRRQRAALLSLPDHLLHDIGVSRVDVEREADKPFWQD